MLKFCRVIFITLTASCFLLSCIKEYSQEGGTGLPGTDTSGGPGLPVPAEWEFSENNARYHGPVDTAYLQVVGQGQTIRASGRAAIGNEKIELLIRTTSSPIEAGKTYTTLQNQLTFKYTSPTATIFSAAPYTGGDMYFTVTSVGEDRITGTFMGIARTPGGRSVEIKDGKFSSPLKKPQATDESAAVIFWTGEEWSKPVYVKLNNQQQQLSKWANAEPVCDDEGWPNFRVRPGTWQWTAYCGGDSVTGTIDPGINSCTKVKITFPFSPPDTTTTDPQADCKLQQISYSGRLVPTFVSGPNLYDLPNSLVAEYTGNIVDKIKYTILFLPNAPLVTLAVERTGNNIFLARGGSIEKKFVTDGAGRALEYEARAEPAVGYPFTPPIHITYTYDGAGRLIQRVTKSRDNNATLSRMQLDWDNNMLTKITEDFDVTGMKKEIFLTYHTDRTVRNHPWTDFNAIEMVLFQTVVNFGIQPPHPLKGMRVVAYNASGFPMSDQVLDYSHYIIDANGYVTRLWREDIYDQGVYFHFNYQCF